jgi:hypothetical protein
MASFVEPRSFEVLLVSTDKRVELLILALKKREERVTPEILPEMKTSPEAKPYKRVPTRLQRVFANR